MKTRLVFDLDYTVEDHPITGQTYEGSADLPESLTDMLIENDDIGFSVVEHHTARRDVAREAHILAHSISLTGLTREQQRRVLFGETPKGMTLRQYVTAMRAENEAK